MKPLMHCLESLQRLQEQRLEQLDGLRQILPACAEALVGMRYDAKSERLTLFFDQKSCLWHVRDVVGAAHDTLCQFLASSDALQVHVRVASA